MIILHFHLQTQYKYELFHIYYTSRWTVLYYDQLLAIPAQNNISKFHFDRESERTTLVNLVLMLSSENIVY